MRIFPQNTFGTSAFRGSRGFSLVEVLCAILILGIGMVGLTQGLTTALTSSKESEEQTTAALLASGRIESIRADGFLIEGTDQGDGEQGLSQYHWEQTISRTELDGLYDVKVVVQKAKSGQMVYELETQLFDPPVQSASQDTTTRRDNGDSRRRNRRRE
jgi:type IV pilus modification protein PilV